MSTAEFRAPLSFTTNLQSIRNAARAANPTTAPTLATSVIDPHVHLWDQRNTPRVISPLVKLFGWNDSVLRFMARRLFPKSAVRFFGKPDHVLADYLAPEYGSDVEDRDVGFVHVEAGWVGKGPLGPVAETRWLESLGAPALKGIVGHADLSLGDAVDEVLAAHVAASPRFRGVRQMLSHHPGRTILSGAPRPGLTRDPAWRRGYELLAKYGLSFDAVVYDHQLGEIEELARDFPQVPIVLCHMGTPVGAAGAFGGVGKTDDERASIMENWRAGIHAVAQQPNVYIKLSGLAMPCVGWAYHQGAAPNADRVADDFRPFMDFAIDEFGADRCMFASNFPIDKVSLSWATLYGAFARIAATRTATERRSLFHDTASRVYRLG